MPLNLRGDIWLILVGISWNLIVERFSKFCLITRAKRQLEFSCLCKRVEDLESYWSDFHDISYLSNIP